MAGQQHEYVMTSSSATTNSTKAEFKFKLEGNIEVQQADLTMETGVEVKVERTMETGVKAMEARTMEAGVAAMVNRTMECDVEAMVDRTMETDIEAMIDRTMKTGVTAMADRTMETGVEAMEDRIVETSDEAMVNRIMETGVEVMVDMTMEAGVAAMVNGTMESGVEAMVDRTMGTGVEVLVDMTIGTGVQAMIDRTMGTGVKTKVDRTMETSVTAMVDRTMGTGVEAMVDRKMGTVVEAMEDNGDEAMVDNGTQTGVELDGDSDDDLAEAAKDALLKYTIIDNGVESKPPDNVIPIEAIKKAANSIGQTATVLIQDNTNCLHKCTACYEVFKTETELIEHTLEHVDAELCSNCGRVFDSNRALLIHKSYCLKSGSKLAKEQAGLYKCSMCDRSFSFKSTLVNHKRTVHVTKGYVCALCNKGFPLHGDLVRHSYTHSPNKPFQCDKPGCNKGFTCKSSLNKHIRLKHDIDKVYRCVNCSKTFQMECDIQRHMFTHTTVRPFKCTLCPKSYTCKSSLKQHINMIHGKKKQKLPCVFCPRTFGTQQDLDRHTATHTGSKRWRCSICRKSYACKSSLSVHKRNAHEILFVNDGEKLTEEDLLNDIDKDETEDENVSFITLEDEHEPLNLKYVNNVSKSDLTGKRKVKVEEIPSLSQLDNNGKVKKKRGRKPKRPQKISIDTPESQKSDVLDLKLINLYKSQK